MSKLRMDAFLVARRLPLRQVTGKLWRGDDVVTIAWRGMPHGLDRLLYLWASTMAHERGPAFSFSLAHIGERFGRPWRPSAMIERLHRVACSSLQRTTKPHGNPVIEQLTTFEQLELGATHGRIKLGSLFTEHESRTLDRGVVCTLLVGKGSLAALDLYLWQVEAAWSHRHSLPATVPLHGPGGVFSALPGAIQDPHKARQELRLRLDKIREAWPACPNHLTADCDGFVLEDVA